MERNIAQPFAVSRTKIGCTTQVAAKNKKKHPSVRGLTSAENAVVATLATNFFVKMGTMMMGPKLCLPMVGKQACLYSEDST